MKELHKELQAVNKEARYPTPDPNLNSHLNPNPDPNLNSNLNSNPNLSPNPNNLNPYQREAKERATT